MRHLRNERGAALILTLMMVTLTLLFVLTLLYQVTDTTKQVTKMEENIDARLVAEMGVKYYQTWVSEKVHDQEVEEIEDIVLDVGEMELPNVTDKHPQNKKTDLLFKIDANRCFSINIENYEEEEEEDEDEDEDEDKLIITFTSEGIVTNERTEQKNSSTETIEQTIKITLD